jgi:hypothetical protein
MMTLLRHALDLLADPFVALVLQWCAQSLKAWAAGGHP